MLLVDLSRYYQHLLTKLGEDEFIDVTSSSKKLEEIIRIYNGNDILKSSGKSRKGNIAYSASRYLEEVIKKADVKDALTLRKEVFKSTKILLSKDSKLSNIMKGETEIPELVSRFFQNLIARPDSRQWKGIRIQSLCENATNCCKQIFSDKQSQRNVQYLK